MTPAALARLHAAAFTRPRPWSAAEFAALLDSPGSFLIAHEAVFVLGRAIAGEAELLTLAVDPARRRQGAGRRLVADIEAEAARRGATVAFLEVAADNAPARALYRAAGWAEAGRRPGYYRDGCGAAEDAIIMAKALPRSAE